jgi:hypothetical protein
MLQSLTVLVELKIFRGNKKTRESSVYLVEKNGRIKSTFIKINVKESILQLKQQSIDGWIDG